MRNHFSALPLLALAASSHAVGTATVTSTGDVTYTLGAGLSYAFSPTSLNYAGRAAGRYTYDWDSIGTSVPESHNPVFEYLDDTNLNLVAQVADPARYSLSLSGGASGTPTGTNRLVLSSTATATFSAAANDPGDLFAFRRYGYRYFMQVTNGSTVPQFALFNFNNQQRTLSGAVNVPVDLTANLGQYAEAGGVMDVIDTSTDETDEYTLTADTFSSADGRSFSTDYTYPLGGRGYTVAPGATVEYEIYSSSYLFIEDDHRRAAPVPEPAPLAALSVGALGLLRRRRKHQAA